MDLKKNGRFKITMPVTKAKLVKGKRIITGLASGTDVDLHDERMAPSAIRSMADSIKGTTLELRSEHSQSWDSRLGEITALQVDKKNQLIMKAELDKTNKADDLWKRLIDRTKPVRIGLSIGGRVLDSGLEYIKRLDRRIKTYYDIALEEVSVTAQPAWPKSWAQAISKSVDWQNAKRMTSKTYINKVQKLLKAVWTTEFINKIPDAGFAIILPDGKKDEDGMTVPRRLRKLPHHNQNVKNPNENNTVDKPHLRNALARVEQTDMTDAQKARARSHLEAHAKALGIGEVGRNVAILNNLLTNLKESTMKKKKALLKAEDEKVEEPKVDEATSDTKADEEKPEADVKPADGDKEEPKEEPKEDVEEEATEEVTEDGEDVAKMELLKAISKTLELQDKRLDEVETSLKGLAKEVEACGGEKKRPAKSKKLLSKIDALNKRLRSVERTTTSRKGVEVKKADKKDVKDLSVEERQAKAEKEFDKNVKELKIPPRDHVKEQSRLYHKYKVPGY